MATMTKGGRIFKTREARYTAAGKEFTSTKTNSGTGITAGKENGFTD